MHTFCQYCVTKWKTESPTAGCPLCRDPGLFERRNFLVDNMIAIIVNLYSEKEQIIRKKFEKQRKELHRNLLADGLRTPNNPFYRITERGLVLGEMQIEELPSFTQGQFSQFEVTMQIYDLSVAYFTCLTVPSPVVSSSAMVTSIVRSLTRNPVISRERLDNRRRLHYTRLLVNIGRRRLMSRTNIFQSMSVSPWFPFNVITNYFFCWLQAAMQSREHSPTCLQFWLVVRRDCIGVYVLLHRADFLFVLHPILFASFID